MNFLRGRRSEVPARVHVLVSAPPKPCLEFGLRSGGPVSAVARAGRPDLVHNSVSGIVLCYDVGVIEVRHQVDPTRQILVSSNSPTQESEFFSSASPSLPGLPGSALCSLLGLQARLLLRAKANVNDSDAKGAAASESIPLEAAPADVRLCVTSRVSLYCGAL